MKTRPEPQYAPRITEIIISLSCEPQWILLLKGRNKPYEMILSPLFEYFKDIEYTNAHLDTAKGMSQIFDLPVQIFTKFLRQIYFDIFDLNYSEPELFKTEGVRYDLSFTSYAAYANFSLWLAQPLNVNDSFTFNFLKAKLNLQYYYVKQIRHEYYNGQQMVFAELDTDEPNIYRELISDKALFYKKMGYSNKFLRNYELDVILKKIYPY